MNDYIINGSSLTNIANAIREKVGDGNVTYLPSEMPDAIKRISSSGGSEGKTYGFLNQINFSNKTNFTSVLKMNFYNIGTEFSNIDISANSNYFIYQIKKSGVSGDYIIKSDLDILYLNENSSNLFYGSQVCLEYPIDYFTEIFNFEYVKDFSNAFSICNRVYGQPICGNNVNNMAYTYAYCNGLTGYPVCGNNVINMSYAYCYCNNLTGSPVCGNNVVNMAYTYYNCCNLTSSPACGNNVINMVNAYYNCYNLTGSPVCGDNVTNMYFAYYLCHNLTGSPACGDNVVDMSYAYYGCGNLVGPIICGNNVINMAYAFLSDLYGDMYIYYNQSQNSSDVNMYQCFYNRNSSNRLNIYVKENSAYNNWLYNVGKLNNATRLTWTTMDNGYYNTGTNTYVYYNL